jgi:FAD/FMN-containing dehydrogenase
MLIHSWGRLEGTAEAMSYPAFASDIARAIGMQRPAPRCLVIGNLRSYGDEVLNGEGRYVGTTRCDRILAFDPRQGTITAESGITLRALQERLGARGFMLPVTPGTAHLTLGGAIANDVHGKNHHVAGTFGRYVRSFDLARSTGEIFSCSPEKNPDLFAASIGGMGLTGAIMRATLALRRMASPHLRVVSTRFANLAEFFALDARASDRHEYSVAWIDCLGKGRALGRGIFSVADHLPVAPPEVARERRTHGYRIAIPCELPVSPVNRLSLSVMNTLYYRAHRTGERIIHHQDWLYPLDAIKNWNRLYGRRGFFQFQCVIPRDQAHAAVTRMLETIATRQQGSFLAVLKNFGSLPSPGLMSFPMPGTTLALDFPNRGEPTRALLLALYGITAAAGGRLYPAKDACSPAESLELGYPNFARFKQFVDPGFGSLMARRLRLVS